MKPDLFDLSGQCAVVTGAARGLAQVHCAARGGDKALHEQL